MVKTRPTTGGSSRKEDTEEIPPNPNPNPPASASASASAASSRSQSQPGAYHVFPTPLTDGLSSVVSSCAVVEAAGVGGGGGSRNERHGSSSMSRQPSVEDHQHEHEAIITDAAALPIASEVHDEDDVDDDRIAAEAGAGEAETMTAALASGMNTASDVVVMDSDAIARHEQRLVDRAKEETKRELDDRHRASKRRMVLGGAVVVLVVAVVAIAAAVAVTARGSTGGSNGASEATVGAEGNTNGNTNSNGKGGGAQAQPDLFPGCVQQNVLVGNDLSSAALATVIGGGADSTKVDIIAALNRPHVSVEYLEQVNFPPRDEENTDNDTEETTTTTNTTTIKTKTKTEIRRHIVHPLEDEALELEIGSVDVADFNGDGLPDVVVSEKEMGTLYLYLQNARDNDSNSITFSGHVLATDLPDMESIRAADMNADGLVDIVVVVEDLGLVLLFENNGMNITSAEVDDGAGDAESASPQPLSPFFIRSTISDLPQTPEGIDIVDFNDDGLLDILVASDDDGSVFLFQQLRDGTYQDSVLLTGLEDSKHVAVADLDGDGLLDLVTATSDDASVSWYRQIPPELPLLSSSSSPYGNFTFGEKAVIFDAIPEVVVAITADMDGDGDIDIVATSEELSLTYLFENDGEANFLNHLVFEGIVLFDENDLALADVNGDGQLDIISNGADGSKATVSYFDLSECFQ